MLETAVELTLEGYVLVSLELPGLKSSKGVEAGICDGSVLQVRRGGAVGGNNVVWTTRK